MKRFKLVFFLTILFLIVFSFLFFSEYNKNLSLRRELKEKSKELKEAEEMRKKLKELEKSKKEQLLRLKELERELPEESGEVSLMKEITSLAIHFGVRNIEFVPLVAKDNVEGQRNLTIPFYTNNVRPHMFRINMEIEFPYLVSFLKNIMNMERVISVENIEIKREENIIPRQKVSLDIISYTFIPHQ
ncbi:MAG: hypothetical protein B6D55_00665 [Candidatus Omnitrophica bacterium 4484_70.2]|nr:MAG: hypothetical protein B6D55_00665 [Candidatus Omnitrophica bacterium 4484_70.2]